MNLISKTLTVAGFATLAVSANATLTTIGPFSGTLSETFESFSNYAAGPFNQPEPFLVMGGNASFDSALDDLVIYDPVNASFGLGGSGGAQVSDGVQGMGMNFGPNDSWTLMFVSDTNDFGAFWGAATSGGPVITGVEFYDSSNVVVGSTSFAYDHETTSDGVLEWNGWNSDVAFRSVKVTGNYVVIDGMQATNAVPEPATMSVLALGALAMLRRRKSAK